MSHARQIGSTAWPASTAKTQLNIISKMSSLANPTCCAGAKSKRRHLIDRTRPLVLLSTHTICRREGKPAAVQKVLN